MHLCIFSAGLVTSEGWSPIVGPVGMGTAMGSGMGSASALGAVAGSDRSPSPGACRLHDAPALCDALRRWHRCPELHKAIDGINYIADQTRKEEESTRVICRFRLLYMYPAYIEKIYLHTFASLVGERGLEVRGNGPGPAIPVDLYVGGAGGISWHHFAGAYAVR